MIDKLAQVIIRRYSLEKHRLAMLVVMTVCACVQEYAVATAEAEMAEAKAVRQGEEAEAFRRIAG